MADDYEKKMTDEMSKQEKDVYKNYSNKMRAESDLHTLTEAKDIKEDKERFQMAIACAKHKVKDIKKISEMGDDD